MDFFQLTMRILSAMLMLYFILIMIRVFLSWIQVSSPGMNKLRNFIYRVTNPYMKNFTGISWLKFGMFDFSPILGLAILSFFLYLTQNLASGHFPGVGELLVWLISLIWSVARFFLMILAIVMIVRLITLYTMKHQRPQWMDRLDAFLFPRVSRIMGIFTGKPLPYPAALGISALMLLIVYFGINFLLARFLYPLLMRL